MTTESGSTAVILSGAVAKGAFEAGALEVLAEHGLRIHSVMGTSAGALCAAVYAAGIRAGKEGQAARQLSQLWREHGTWADAFTLSAKALFAGQGIAVAGGFVAKMDEVLEELLSSGNRQPVGLSLVVCPLIGTTDEGESATTFERVAYFENEDFDVPERRRHLRDAAVASAAFPGAYAPVKLEGIGPCVDGGVVNNTPVKHALESDSRGVRVDRVVVINPHPVDYNVAEPGRGLNYGMHLLNVLLQERLYRDLKSAYGVNKKLRQLEALVGQNGFTPEHFEMVRSVLGWRPLEIVEIRPDDPLPGNPFTGFGDAYLREKYIEAGKEAARLQLGTLGLGGVSAAAPAR